jgi:hypothetical protein
MVFKIVLLVDVTLSGATANFSIGEYLFYYLPTDTRQTDPDLAVVTEFWDRLPATIRSAIMALVRTARETPR